LFDSRFDLFEKVGDIDRRHGHVLGLYLRNLSQVRREAAEAHSLSVDARQRFGHTGIGRVSQGAHVGDPGTYGGERVLQLVVQAHQEASPVGPGLLIGGLGRDHLAVDVGERQNPDHDRRQNGGRSANHQGQRARGAFGVELNRRASRGQDRGGHRAGGQWHQDDQSPTGHTWRSLPVIRGDRTASPLCTSATNR
jgi:hypothetical protein